MIKISINWDVGFFYVSFLLLKNKTMGSDFDYTSVLPVKSYGGMESMHEGSFLLSQCQHLLVDKDTIVVSMLLNRNPRAIDYATGAFKCDISTMGFMDEEFEMAAGMYLSHRFLT